MWIYLLILKKYIYFVYTATCNRIVHCRTRQTTIVYEYIYILYMITQGYHVVIVIRGFLYRLQVYIAIN